MKREKEKGERKQRKREKGTRGKGNNGNQTKWEKEAGNNEKGQAKATNKGSVLKGVRHKKIVNGANLVQSFMVCKHTELYEMVWRSLRLDSLN